MAMISNDWLPALDQEFHKAYYRDLFTFVKQEYNTHVIYPPADDIFNALHFTPLSEVKVLILGQDPYHNEHQAQANSHQGRGWEQFTDAIIQAVNAQDRPIVYMLWGRPAQSKITMLTNPKHLILKAPHPSPLSAYRGFFGCRHFSQANAFLEKNGIAPIDWQIEDV